MNVEWRTILNGDYEISNDGQMRRATPGRRTYVGRPMKPVLMKIGYFAVGPTIDGKNKTLYIHHLVAEAFLGLRPDGLSINHIDGIKTNNHISNLEYVSHAENMAHASRAGLMVCGEKHPAVVLSDATIREMRTAREMGASYSRLSADFSVSIGHAWQIIQGNVRKTA